MRAYALTPPVWGSDEGATFSSEGYPLDVINNWADITQSSNRGAEGITSEDGSFFVIWTGEGDGISQHIAAAEHEPFHPTSGLSHLEIFELQGFVATVSGLGSVDQERIDLMRQLESYSLDSFELSGFE